MNTIQLGKEVMVSDPCYSNDIWCQKKLTNVLPGEYVVTVDKKYTGDWGNRCSTLMVIHKDYVDKDIKWKCRVRGNIGVDSGQCGIFSMDTFRKDGLEVTIPETTINRDFFLPVREPGDDFYLKMCKLTLSDQLWGSYENGVVSRSGYGDGGYDLYVKTDKRKVVGILIDFFVE